jgi:hypothetical protein
MICPTELLFEQLPRSRASRSKAWNHHATPPINGVEQQSCPRKPFRFGRSLGSVFQPMKMKKIARISKSEPLSPRQVVTTGPEKSLKKFRREEIKPHVKETVTEVSEDGK